MRVCVRVRELTSHCTGVQMPNVLGRGEKLQAEYSMGYRSSNNFSVAATKPYPHKPLVPV